MLMDEKCLHDHLSPAEKGVANEFACPQGNRVVGHACGGRSKRQQSGEGPVATREQKPRWVTVSRRKLLG
jgi:hypothetical protein